MTKTLTEQWRDGTLPEGYYYITSKKWGMLIDRYRDQINDCGHKWRGFDNCQGVVEEVLAPVPSYDEIKCLQEQLKEANAIIEDMRPFIQASMSRQTFTRILNYEDKCGVK